MRLEELPEIPLQTILSYLDSYELTRLGQTSKSVRKIASSEVAWKRLALNDLPWFFYNETCERTLATLVDAPRAKESSILQVDTNLSDSERPEPVCDGDFGVRCSCRYQKSRINPYHPLPDSYQASYRLIMSGNYTGLIQVLNSLKNRAMSAFTALATVDPLTKEINLSYSTDLISRYRRGEFIILTSSERLIVTDAPITPTSEVSSPSRASRIKYKIMPSTQDLIDEKIPLTERQRFRRVPLDLLDWNPREIYSRELFMRPCTKSGRPIFKKGEEVEIQWRIESNQGFGWWRGFVAAVYMSAENSDEEEIGLDEIENESIDGDLEGILVLFPHYPPDCDWFSVVISLNGVERPNPPATGALGLVGGIRRVTCLAHKALWQRNFQFVNLE